MTLSDPYPINGYVYEKDGVTPVVGAVVTAFDVTKQKWIDSLSHATTNSSGEYTIDAGNVIGGYDNGDVLHIVASGDNVCTDHRHIIDTTVGTLTKNLIIRHGRSICGDAFVKSISISNNYLTTKPMYIDFYNRVDASPVFRVWCDFGKTEQIIFPSKGQMFHGGCCPVFEDDTAGYLDCIVTRDGSEE